MLSPDLADIARTPRQAARLPILEHLRQTVLPTTSRLLIFASLALSSCVSTPQPKPVTAVQLGDAQLSYAMLRAEYVANTEAAERKIAKNKNSDVKDFAVGFLVWPGLADFNNAPGHEGNALLDRNSRLRALAEAKGYVTNDWPKQPKSY